MLVGQRPVGHELELALRGDAIGMADRGLDDRAGLRQEFIEQGPRGRRDPVVLVGRVEIVALPVAGADIAQREVLALHPDARARHHLGQQPGRQALVQRENLDADLGQRAAVAADLVGDRLPGVARPGRAEAAETAESRVVFEGTGFELVHRLDEGAVGQIQISGIHRGILGGSQRPDYWTRRLAAAMSGGGIFTNRAEPHGRHPCPGDFPLPAPPRS